VTAQEQKSWLGGCPQSRPRPRDIAQKTVPIVNSYYHRRGAPADGLVAETLAAGREARTASEASAACFVAPSSPPAGRSRRARPQLRRRGHGELCSNVQRRGIIRVVSAKAIRAPLNARGRRHALLFREIRRSCGQPPAGADAAKALTRLLASRASTSMPAGPPDVGLTARSRPCA